MGFLVENLQHEVKVNGKVERIACGKLHGDSCPICDAAAHAYDEKGENNPALGKHLYRKKSFIGQILVLETPIEHDQEQLVKLVEFGPAIFKVMQAAFTSGDLEVAPYELKGGYNFRLVKTKDGQYASYTTSSFSPKQSDIADDVIDSLVLQDLRSILPEAPTTDQLKVFLDRAMVAFSGGSGHVYAKEAAEPPAEVIAETKPATPMVGEDGRKLSVVEALRLRKAQKAAEEQA
jgi:hypothetical protein